MIVTFFKYQGTGNDFIILDNRTDAYRSLTETQIKKLCDRRFGIGADGLMMMQNKDSYDYEMIYHNADGKVGSMCGNGGRCMIRFAYNNGIVKYTYRFWAADGFHEGEIGDNHEIRLKMQDVAGVKKQHDGLILNTGSPHYVKFVSDIKKVDVFEKGKEIRNNKDFAEKGINVNFVEETEAERIFVRTFERGVEDETLSCGTGVTAAALVSTYNHLGFNRVEVQTSGGELSVEFNNNDNENFDNIWLCGPAEFVFKGEVEIK